MPRFSSSLVLHKKLIPGLKELTLCEMLGDPIIQDVMRSDGVTRADVLAAYRIEDCAKLRFAA